MDGCQCRYYYITKLKKKIKIRKIKKKCCYGSFFSFLFSGNFYDIKFGDFFPSPPKKSEISGIFFCRKTKFPK
jgi:hypothetical protein